MSRRVVEQHDWHIWTNGTLGPVRLTRRSLLGLAAVAVAGCHKAAKHGTATRKLIPDASAIYVARQIEHDLLAGYDKKIAAASAATRPGLVVQRAIHATHLKALGTGYAGPARFGNRITPGIHAELRQSVGELQQLALKATDGANAALLASIAASHQVSLG